MHALIPMRYDACIQKYYTRTRRVPPVYSACSPPSLLFPGHRGKVAHERGRRGIAPRPPGLHQAEVVVVAKRRLPEDSLTFRRPGGGVQRGVRRRDRGRDGRCCWTVSHQVLHGRSVFRTASPPHVGVLLRRGLVAIEELEAVVVVLLR